MVQPLRAAVPEHAEGLGIGVRPPADTPLRLEDEDGEAEFLSAPRGREPGGAGADHDHIRA